MVRHHLYQTQRDPQFRIALIEEAMGDFYRYMFVMPTLARFEQIIHRRVEQGQPLTADVMNETMAELFEEGYGPEVVPDRPRVGVTWATFPTHICKNFYTFKYTLGISAAHALAAGIFAGETEAAKRYLELLKAGGSLPPLEAMARAGVDMTTPAPVQAAFEVMTQWLDRLEALLGERVAETR